MKSPFNSSPAQAPLDISRRWFFQQCGVGLGTIALADLLTREGRAASQDSILERTAHFAPKAKRVIFLFMAGAPSQLELLDHKPKLAEFDGTLPPAELLKGYRAAFINPNSALLGPKFSFSRHGQAGIEVSELMPHLAGVIDDVCVIRGMHTDAFNHAPGQIMMNTGSQMFGRPSIGAWVTYGLGSETSNLPGFVVFSSGSKGPSGGNSNWGSGFLPTRYQGVQLRGGQEPVLFLNNPKGIDRRLQKDTLDTINRLNSHRLDIVGDPEIATRISSYEMAFRMQAHAPEVMDISREPQHILDLYGAKPGESSFANNCVLARRLVERGVRFVELFHEAWDQHGGLVSGLKTNCRDTDQAAAALITDLKQRGMLDETLVIWGGEFGRTPMVQGGNDGRDHHPNAFTMWLAGGGIKGGITHGESDELGFNVARDPVHVHDLHATVLHLLGFDHTRLTYRFQGRDFRLTDVHGNIVNPILA